MLTYHDNVANRLSDSFYRTHGAKEIMPALETMKTLPGGDLRVMTTRYCLRREMEYCLRTPAGNKWPRELYLRSDADTFCLQFDCAMCRMHIIKVAKSKSNL